MRLFELGRACDAYKGYGYVELVSCGRGRTDTAMPLGRTDDSRWAAQALFLVILA